jgi:uncharacterized protein YcbK (DUF882 family)
MGDLTKNFSKHEFECNCGECESIIDMDLVHKLQSLRDLFGSIKVTSAFRCPDWNRKVGGSPTSQHLRGKAADLQFRDDVPLQEVYDYLTGLYPDTHGVGIYDNFIHFDVRSKKARWDMRT